MADDHDALLAEVDIRAPNGTGRWSGNYDLLISDPELARQLASALRDLQARHAAALTVIRLVDDLWNITHDGIDGEWEWNPTEIAEIEAARAIPAPLVEATRHQPQDTSHE